jgi:hypothetical protein
MDLICQSMRYSKRTIRSRGPQALLIAEPTILALISGIALGFSTLLESIIDKMTAFASAVYLVSIGLHRVRLLLYSA